MENNRNDARSSLDSVDTARAAAADRLITPWWYHPVLGILFGGFVVVNELGDSLAVMVGFLVFFGSVGILASLYKRRTGVWINGFRAGRATRWTIAMVLTIGLVAAAVIGFHEHSGPAWPVWAAGVLLAVLVTVFGLGFDRTLRRDLRGRSVSVPASR